MAAGRERKRKALLRVQVLTLGFSVLHLISSEADRPAGLALITTLRKRLENLPGATDNEQRVRAP